MADLEYLIALGSNLSYEGATPSAILDAARTQMIARGFVIRKCSRYFCTPAYPAGSGPDFVNAVLAARYAGSASQVLEQLHHIEAEAGRARRVRWGARTLDLDLIAAGDLVLPNLQTHDAWRELPLELQQTSTPSELIVPHPRVAERAFVLVPLCDVAPHWCHPVTGATAQHMRDALPVDAREEVQAL